MMAMKTKNKPTLDRPATYQISVPGVLNASWMKWNQEISFETGIDDNGQPITTLTIIADQAALHGLLRRIYSLGLPLISVIYIDERKYK